MACHYTPHERLAFSSVVHIIHDVHEGWLFRSLHRNGASFFFFLYLRPYWPWHILPLLYSTQYLNSWGDHIPHTNGNCFYRLCPTLGTNILLRGNCYY